MEQVSVPAVSLVVPFYKLMLSSGRLIAFSGHQLRRHRTVEPRPDESERALSRHGVQQGYARKRPGVS